MLEKLFRQVYKNIEGRLKDGIESARKERYIMNKVLGIN